MKFTVDRDFFANGLQQVSNATGSRNTRPILGNVLIEAYEGCITLTATNLEMGIRVCLPGQIQRPGKTTLPAKKLASIVALLPKQDVDVTASDEDQVKIQSGSATFRMMGIKAADFPALPESTSALETFLAQDSLQRMLKSVSYAQSHDENRYILNGVHLKLREGKLTLAATDGRRLAMVSSPVEEQGSAEIILPARAVSELERLLGKGERIRVAFSEGHVAFGLELNPDIQQKGLIKELYLVSKVVDGDYPDYLKVIPKESAHRIKVDRGLMYECVRRCALVVSPKNNSIRMKVSNPVIEFSASSPEYGDSQETMAIQYDGPDVQLAFNPNFILEPLSCLTQDELTFEFGDELSPGLFKTQAAFVCVIMPLKVS